ncbi:WD40 repeat-like protein [Hymenopellis radicata]|nr:WD40 repeat-like protein [Hymenopellis radicata]
MSILPNAGILPPIPDTFDFEAWRKIPQRRHAREDAIEDAPKDTQRDTTRELVPPPPIHILRTHTAPVTALFISGDNERIYSGDFAGWVICTLTRTLRPVVSWKAHEDGLLGVQECGEHVITQARDNKLHVWARVEEYSLIGGSAALAESRTPELKYSLDVNALNYCRFSVLETAHRLLIALPNLVESSEADIWTLPSCQRLHAAIGREAKAQGPILSNDGRGRGASGIIMSMHLFSAETSLRLLLAHENGSVVLRSSARPKSVEGISWDVIWSVKSHVEAVMAMTVNKDNTTAFTVSADHLIGRYDLVTGESEKFKTKQGGNGSVAVRDDGRVCAVGGWDGKIRLYSTKTFKPLGTLKYHKASCQAVAFAHSDPTLPTVSDDEDEELDESEKADRSRWLVGAGKDKLVSVWSLMSFEKSSRQ